MLWLSLVQQAQRLVCALQQLMVGRSAEIIHTNKLGNSAASLGLEVCTRCQKFLSASLHQHHHTSRSTFGATVREKGWRFIVPHCKHACLLLLTAVAATRCSYTASNYFPWQLTVRTPLMVQGYTPKCTYTPLLHGFPLCRGKMAVGVSNLAPPESWSHCFGKGIYPVEAAYTGP